MRMVPTLVLASASPRRRELLGFLGAVFTQSANNAETEHIFPPPTVLAQLPAFGLALDDHPTLLAWRKVSTACIDTDANVIIGADTIVVLDDTVLNKPKDARHAHDMLRRLSGRTHTVYTGVALMTRPAPEAAWEITFELVQSEVMLEALSDAEITAYVATGDPLDKAGAYGIQGLDGRLVRGVTGSYTNVVGLPLTVVHRLLRDAGVVGLLEPSAAYGNWLRAQGKEPLPCPPTLP